MSSLGRWRQQRGILHNVHTSQRAVAPNIAAADEVPCVERTNDQRDTCGPSASETKQKQLASSTSVAIEWAVGEGVRQECNDGTACGFQGPHRCPRLLEDIEAYFATLEEAMGSVVHTRKATMGPSHAAGHNENAP